MADSDGEDVVNAVWDSIQDDDLMGDVLGLSLGGETDSDADSDDDDSLLSTEAYQDKDVDNDNIDLLEAMITSTRNGEHQILSSVSQFTNMLAKTGIRGPQMLKTSNLAQRATKIGEGAQFTVYREVVSRDITSYEGLVIKKVNIPLVGIDGKDFSSNSDYRAQLRTIELEISALCTPTLRNHRNIVQLMAWGYDYPRPDLQVPVLFVELALTTLTDFLLPKNEYRMGDRSIDIKYHLALDTIAGIQALHQLNIVHGDIKPDNVLIFEDPTNKKVPFCAKISDFGVCIDMEAPGGQFTLDDYRGTPGWLPPELDEDFEWDKEQDFKPEIFLQFDSYSLGLTIVSIFITGGKPPVLEVEGEDPLDVAMNLIREDSSIPAKIQSQICSALRKLLQSDPWKRGPPDTEYLRLDLEAFTSWWSVPHTAGNAKASSGLGAVDPIYWRGPNFWRRLDDALVKELIQQQSLSATDSSLKLDGETLFGLALNGTFFLSPGYLDNFISYVTESARSGYSPARAVYAQIMHAHGRELKFNNKTLDKWALQSLAEGYLFSRPSSSISEDQVAMAKQVFRDAGGYVTESFVNKPNIINLARNLQQAKEWQTSSSKVIDRRRNSLLHTSAALGALDVVKWQVENANVDVDIQNDNLETPLYHACQAGQAQVVEYLLEKGAKGCIKTKDSLTPLHWLFVFPGQCIANIATRLVQGGADVNAIIIPRADTNAGGAKVRTLIKHFPFELPFGTPLHWAAFSSNRDAMEALLSLGADINATYHDTGASTTALALSAWQGNLEVVEFLLSRGANSCMKDEDNGNILHHLSDNFPERHGYMMPHWYYWLQHGSSSNHLQVMKRMIRALVDSGVEFEARRQKAMKFTPLRYASDQGYAGIVCALLDLGADPHVECGKNSTVGNAALHDFAGKVGSSTAYPDGYAQAFRKVAEAVRDVDEMNEWGETPFKLLFQHFRKPDEELFEQCEILFNLQPGLKVDFEPRRSDFTLLELSLATKEKNQDARKRALYLLEKGADPLRRGTKGDDVFCNLMTNDFLSDKDTHDILLELLSKIAKIKGESPEDAQSIYQKYFLPSSRAICTLSTAVSAGRLKTTKLLLELGLAEKINDILPGDPPRTILDAAIWRAGMIRDNHFHQLAKYRDKESRKRAIAEKVVYQVQKESPERAAEAYAAAPKILHVLQANGAKVSGELPGFKPTMELCLPYQPDYRDVQDLWWLGLTLDTQPDREEWEILYKVTRFPESWREQVVDLLFEDYSEGAWRPDMDLLNCIKARQNPKQNLSKGTGAINLQAMDWQLIERMTKMLPTLRVPKTGPGTEEPTRESGAWVEARETKRYGKHGSTRSTNEPGPILEVWISMKGEI
ncbi:hypothetical protein FQN57_006417, partial [Myotisia sp. PD_48]